MQTPVQVTLEEYWERRRQWLDERTVSWPTTGEFSCVDCGKRILAQAVALELHRKSFDGCQGDGEEMETGVPYCPGCEEQPAKRGCVHV